MHTHARVDVAQFRGTRVHWGELRGSKFKHPPPIWIFRILFNCVLAKYTVQALLLHWLNPKCATGKSEKSTLISHFSSAFGGLPPQSATGALPLDPTGDELPSPWPGPTTWTPCIVKSWVRLCFTDWKLQCAVLSRKRCKGTATVRISNLGLCGDDLQAKQ